MTTADPARSGRLPINGLSLYYEVHGELGPSNTSPLLLIRGAFMATDSMRSWVSAFADTRTVLVFDQQGHGRTPHRGCSFGSAHHEDELAAEVSPFAHAVRDRGVAQGVGGDLRQGDGARLDKIDDVLEVRAISQDRRSKAHDVVT